jgi:hypothetical protein
VEGMECNMDEQAAETELSPGSFTSGVNGGSAPPSGERGIELPHRVAAAIKRLGIASSLLRTLSVASGYDRHIDTSSAGVAEIAGRLIDEAVMELDPSQSTESTATGAPR